MEKNSLSPMSPLRVREIPCSRTAPPIMKSDGKLVDTSNRHPASRQLKMETDKDLISDCGNPAFVLGGWVPEIDPETGLPN